MASGFQHKRRQHRDQCQRKQERAAQGDDDGDRNRREKLSLQALQRKQREKYKADNDDAGGHGQRDLGGRVIDAVKEWNALVRVRDALDGVLDDNHRRVDDQADRDGQAAKAHEIGRHSEELHRQEGDEGGHRQSHSHHKCRAQAAEEEKQKHDDQDRRL